MTLVLGLPRGGVPVAYEVALNLRLPMDIFIVRKLGVPGHEELAMGAIASGGVRLLNHDIIESFQISTALVEQISGIERSELDRREATYRDHGPQPAVEGRKVILVDDGLATGATMIAAIMALEQKHVNSIVVAVPVGASATIQKIRAMVSEVVAVSVPQDFKSVGSFYLNFRQTSDEEVCALLRDAREGFFRFARSE